MMTVRRVLEIIFLGVFVAAVVTGFMQPWMAITLGLIVASIFLGRIYCGFVCPILTGTDVVET